MGRKGQWRFFRARYAAKNARPKAVYESLVMPIMRTIKGRPELRPIEMEDFTRMTMTELIEYEQKLWRWADTAGSTQAIADVLNAIYREVEWRAQERDWRNAAYPGRRP